MQQDIPIEASEASTFTPSGLVAAVPMPAFTLGTPTSREKRFQRRMLRENGVETHSKETMRKELLAGFREMWSADEVETWTPLIEQYWEARDQFDVESALDPALEWSFDPRIETGVKTLERKVAKTWPAYGVMRADNAEFSELNDQTCVAVVLKGWTGFDVPVHLDRNYLTIDCVDAVKEELDDLDRAAGLANGASWDELVVACAARMFLDEEEAKNFVSPSPSPTTQPASTEISPSQVDGESPASASSTEIPEIA